MLHSPISIQRIFRLLKLDNLLKIVIWLTMSINLQRTYTAESEETSPVLPCEECIVNYVWINESPFKPETKSPVCGVPLHYIDQALKNAKRYPDTPFILWLDYNFLDPTSRFIVESHIYYNDCENVKVQDLHAISSYHNSDIFSAKEPTARLFARTDLARLLVIQHGLDNMPNKPYVFYADFDTDDVNIGCPISSYSLRAYGMFYGLTKPNFGFENSFLAFTKQQYAFLTKRLIPSTVYAAQEGDNGFGSLVRTLSDWLTENDISSDSFYSTLSAKRSHPMGYVMPSNPFYIECGLN